MSQKRIKQRIDRKKAIASAGAATAIALSPATGVIAAPIQTLCTSDCVLNVDGESIDVDLDNNGTPDLQLQVGGMTYTNGPQLNVARLGQSLQVWAREATCWATIFTTTCKSGTASGGVPFGYFYIPPIRPGRPLYGTVLKTNDSFATLSSSSFPGEGSVTAYEYNTECASGEWYTSEGGMCIDSCVVIYPSADCLLWAEVPGLDQIRAGELRFDHNGTNQAWVWMMRSDDAVTIVGWGHDDESGQRNELPDPPTSVTLNEFTAILDRAVTRLLWSTASESNCAGFNILRANSPDGPFVQINTSLIPSNGATEMGATYTFEDINTLPNTPYIYAIEEIDSNGNGNAHSVSLKSMTTEEARDNGTKNF